MKPSPLVVVTFSRYHKIVVKLRCITNVSTSNLGRLAETFGVMKYSLKVEKKSVFRLC